MCALCQMHLFFVVVVVKKLEAIILKSLSNLTMFNGNI